MSRVVWLLILVVACGDNVRGPHVLMDEARPNGLFDAPFPDDRLRDGDHVDIAAVPNPTGAPSVETVRGLLADNDGFAISGGVFFAMSTAIDAGGLPSIEQSVTEDASVFLVGIDADAPDFGVRYPLEVSFVEEGSPYGAPNLLALLPVQGIPLRTHTRYAAVVTTSVRATTGEPLERAGDRAAHWSAEIATLGELGVARERIAGITVFTTGDPTAKLAAVRTVALARPLPAIAAPFARDEVFAEYCVYATTIAMPDYQSGTPPFDGGGGTWQYDASGAPIVQRMEPSRITVTVPRSARPPAGYPLVVFVRAGGGGDRPLVDRGQQPAQGAMALEAGEGPARYLARAGFAGLQVEGPLGGLRNRTMGDEQFLLFNVTNIAAMRDNIRESALELSIIANVAAQLHLDASDCPPAGTTDPGPADVAFDAQRFAIMGHSNGAWISPIAAAYEPLFRALILSGAGGSWIENILYKQKPVAPKGVIATLLRVFDLRADDPAMTFIQWALEPADPQSYGAAIAREPPGEPRHVLIAQGVVDNYILPRIANSTNLSIGVDLAGPALDTADDPRLAAQVPLGRLLPLVDRHAIALPASGNVNGTTAIVVQRPEDGIEDGHEVQFQTDAPKHAYQCFLASWIATGTPTVPADAVRDAPCP